MPLWSESQLSSDRTWKVASGGFFFSFSQPSLWMLHGSFLVLTVTARWLALYEAWRYSPSLFLSLSCTRVVVCLIKSCMCSCDTENHLSVGRPHHNCRRSLLFWVASCTQHLGGAVPVDEGGRTAFWFQQHGDVMSHSVGKGIDWAC